MACIYGIEQDCSECGMCMNISKQTNADYVRSLSNEKLAEILVVPFFLMDRLRPCCVYESNSIGRFDNKREAVKAQLEWLESERDKQ